MRHVRCPTFCAETLPSRPLAERFQRTDTTSSYGRHFGTCAVAATVPRTPHGIGTDFTTGG